MTIEVLRAGARARARVRAVVKEAKEAKEARVTARE